MTTLSQAVDSLIGETRRPDMRNTIVSYMNQTIRELHSVPRAGNAVGFSSNLVEVRLTADVETGYVYDIPNSNQFQFIEAVWYEARRKYSKTRSPAVAHAYLNQPDGDIFHYRSGNSIAFAGYGGLGAVIQLAYYAYPRGLKYYDTATRPAQYDEESDTWTYLAAYDVSDATREDARNKTSNWLLGRHTDLILQGTRAKIYVRLADVERARLTYSLYESLRPPMVDAETQTDQIHFNV